MGITSFALFSSDLSQHFRVCVCTISATTITFQGSPYKFILIKSLFLQLSSDSSNISGLIKQIYSQSFHYFLLFLSNLSQHFRAYHINCITCSKNFWLVMFVRWLWKFTDLSILLINLSMSLHTCMNELKKNLGAYYQERFLKSKYLLPEVLKLQYPQ